MSNNSQVQRTKKWLFEALMALMQEVPFKKISVQDIVKRADLSRTAFYSHYSSKEDILCEKVQEYQDEAVDFCLTFEDRSQFKNWRRTIEMYCTHGDFYTLLHKNGLDTLVYQAEMDNYERTAYLVSQTFRGKAPEDRTLYYGTYMPYHRPSQLGLILKWISNSGTTTIDEIAALVSSLSCIHVYNSFREDYYANLGKLELRKAETSGTE